jgi:hypothetical protein
MEGIISLPLPATSPVASSSDSYLTPRDRMRIAKAALLEEEDCEIERESCERVQPIPVSLAYSLRTSCLTSYPDYPSSWFGTGQIPQSFDTTTNVNIL